MGLIRVQQVCDPSPRSDPLSGSDSEHVLGRTQVHVHACLNRLRSRLDPGLFRGPLTALREFLHEETQLGC